MLLGINHLKRIPLDERPDGFIQIVCLGEYYDLFVELNDSTRTRAVDIVFQVYEIEPAHREYKLHVWTNQTKMPLVLTATITFRDSSRVSLTTKIDYLNVHFDCISDVLVRVLHAMINTYLFEDPYMKMVEASGPFRAHMFDEQDIGMFERLAGSKIDTLVNGMSGLVNAKTRG